MNQANYYLPRIPNNFYREIDPLTRIEATLMNSFSFTWIKRSERQQISLLDENVSLPVLLCRLSLNTFAGSWSLLSGLFPLISGVSLATNVRGENQIKVRDSKVKESK